MNLRKLPPVFDAEGASWSLWPWVATSPAGIGRGYTPEEAVAELAEDPK